LLYFGVNSKSGGESVVDDDFAHTISMNHQNEGS